MAKRLNNPSERQSRQPAVHRRCSASARLFCVLVFLTVLVLPLLADAASVTPSDRVTSYLKVRAEPSVASAVVGKLRPGEEAEYVGAVPHWLKVRLSDGSDGFVSKSWATVSGEAPVAPTAISHGALYGGTPRATRPASTFEVLENEGYSVGYSEARRDPLWAAYHLFKIAQPVTHPRPSRFRIDERTEARVKHECYTNSGYDRGHNAPNFAIDTRYGQSAQLETFLMSNISPQEPTLNRQTWEAFEKVEANDYANTFGDIWTVTGPIFDAQPQTITCDVQVPSAFYKIVVREDDGKPAMLAVIMSQDVHGVQPLRTFVTTVDHIEDVTGLDFFSELPDDVENAAEAAQPDDRWDLDQQLVPTHH